MAFKPCTIEEIFKDYSGRRTAILHALTQEVDHFYGLCDPENDKLCLYGHPNEAWEVTLPAEEVLAVLPEPADRGINLARNDMNREDWLSQVALRSDSWLLYVAFYHGALLNHVERESLFSLINNLPTIYEAVERIEDKPAEDSESESHGSIKDEDHGHIAQSEEGQAID